MPWQPIEAGYGYLPSWWSPSSSLFQPSGISLSVKSPNVDPDPVLISDKPWEGGCLNCWATFIEDNGILRCWYEAYSSLGSGDMDSTLLYAESNDGGATWNKPNLGFCEFSGSKNNNIILKNIHGSCVFKDPIDAAERRYKLIYHKWLATNVHEIWSASSPDGFAWQMDTQALLKNPSDTQSVALFDEDISKYVLYTRQPSGWLNDYERRAVGRAETKNFTVWNEPELILASDPTDPPEWDYYMSGYQKWPHSSRAHIMRLGIYYRSTDQFKIHLAVSRNGKIWYRPQGHTPWTEFTPHEYPNEILTGTPLGIIQQPNNTWLNFLYFSPYSHHKTPAIERKQPYGGYWRSYTREDGFICLKAEAEGEFTTVKITFDGQKLILNADVSVNSRLSVSIVNPETGTYYHGFGLCDCDPIQENSANIIVRWHGNADISEFAGKPVRLAFRLFNAELYSYRFE